MTGKEAEGLITVEVKVPSLDAVYDFRLEEDVLVDDLMKEMNDILIKKTKSAISEKNQNFFLCSIDRQAILNPRRTLRQNGIGEGSRLLLV